jgi:hypothetical protein
MRYEWTLLKWICIDACHLYQRASWFNDGEISKVVDTITSLLAEGEASMPPLQAAHIGVMAPWRGQVWKIRESLRKMSLSRVDVGTVEVSRRSWCSGISPSFASPLTASLLSRLRTFKVEKVVSSSSLV